MEIAILGPVMLLLVFSVVQAGLWFYARALALGAAQEGVSAASAYTADPQAGVVAARAFLTRSAADSLTDATITMTGSTPTMVSIQVRGRSLSVLPGVPGIPVTQTAIAPREIFTSPIASGQGP